MKELEKQQNKLIESHYEANKQKEYKMVHQFTPKSGCKLYKWDEEKQSMEEVAITQTATIGLNNKPVYNRIAHYDPTAVYFQAINKKSALNKLKRYKAGDTKVAETFEVKEYLPLVVKKPKKKRRR